MNKRIWIVIMAAMLTGWGCHSEQSTSLNIKERRILDSLYNAEATRLRITSDSICTQLTDSLFTAAVDSLLLLRREEVQALYEIEKDTNE